MEKLLISNSPHIRSKDNTKRIMIDVCLALFPAFLMGIVYFGPKCILIVGLAVVSAVLSEICYKLITKVSFKQILKEFDWTSVVTGLLLGLNLNSSVSWYLPVLGSIFAIIVVKMIFGGTGKNFVNPAIAGRVFLFIAFSTIMADGWLSASIKNIGGSTLQTGATALRFVLKGDFASIPSNLDLLLGTGITGCIGETCKVALLLGGIYLLIRRVIDWKPLIYILVTGLWTVVIKGFNFEFFLPSILSGGLFLGAIFMATDYVTCPNTTIGSYIYFVLLGILTAWLRVRTGGEVVSFVILIMNVCSPLIDRFVVPKPFGYEKPVKQKTEKGASK